jgi:radical SAM superfamily enzyme YgiQ (UPF0313 family)
LELQVRVLFISANTERINMLTMPLGLGLVCAATRSAGHEISFLDLLPEPDARAAVRKAIASFSPDVIGVSVRNIDDQCLENPRFLLPAVRDVIEECRSCSTSPIVVGGAGYSIFPREALDYLRADFGVAGDGESTFPALLDRIEKREDVSDLAGVFQSGRPPRDERACSRDLDTLPLWDPALETTADPDTWVPVQSRRGCPNDCSYCSTALIQGRTIRLRSPQRVARTVEALARRGMRRFFFVDNSFNIPEHHAFATCDALARISPRVTWRAIIYPERLSEELVRAMANAGCSEVSLGFESGSLRVLREMNKRFTPQDVRQTSDLLAAHGIRRFGFLLLGGPAETRESVEESLAFARSLRLDELRITVGIRIYPGTPLAARAVAEGMIANDDDLLRPRFYLAPGLDPWIQDRVSSVS